MICFESYCFSILSGDVVQSHWKRIYTKKNVQWTTVKPWYPTKSLLNSFTTSCWQSTSPNEVSTFKHVHFWSMMVPLSAFERTTEMEIVGYTVKCDTVSHFESHQHEKSGVKWHFYKLENFSDKKDNFHEKKNEKPANRICVVKNLSRIHWCEPVENLWCFFLTASLIFMNAYTFFSKENSFCNNRENSLESK